MTPSTITIEGVEYDLVPKVKNEDIELESFFQYQLNVKKVSDLFYTFTYRGIPCAGQITILPYSKELSIKPMRGTDDIGLGAGQMVIVNFPKKVEREVLLTTEDGVAIYKGHDGDLWRVFTADCSYETWKPFQLGAPQYAIKGEKYFSTEEKAKEYILMNKPCLSIRDIQDQYADDRGFVGTGWLIQKLTELVSSKLK